MEMTNAADLLREARTRARLSQTELARRSGTSQAAVARYESGQVSPAASTLERLLHVCGYRLGLRPAEPGRLLIDVITSFHPEILERAAVHGATNLQVVGSAARGERDTGSTPIELVADIDAEHGTGTLGDLAEDLTVIMGRRVTVASRGPRPPGGLGPAHVGGIPL